MSRQPGAPAVVIRGVPVLADAADLRFAVAASLSAVPIDEPGLRHDVWMLVATERRAGASPGKVITTLVDLVADAALTPRSVCHARLRQVMRWCAEAYFSYLGCVVLRPIPEPRSLPEPASNR
jgi:hypothetical protein